MLDQLHRAADRIELVIDAPETEDRAAQLMQAQRHVRHRHHRARGLGLCQGNRRAFIDDLFGQQAGVEQLHRHHRPHRLGAGFARLVDCEHIGDAGHGQIGRDVLDAAGCHQDQPRHILRISQGMTERDRAAE